MNKNESSGTKSTHQVEESRVSTQTPVMSNRVIKMIGTDFVVNSFF